MHAGTKDIGQPYHSAALRRANHAHLDLCLLHMLLILSIYIFSAFFVAATAELYVHLLHYLMMRCSTNGRLEG